MTAPLNLFRRALLRWYGRHQRALPWRVTNPTTGRADPYHVLVSETMLQQTQVATVIPYFNRFLKKFPDFVALASADAQEVLRLWQGLGYYSRARHLHNAARLIVNEYNGQVPHDVRALMELPGVGRYTAGAIASIAFEKRAPILDGNVLRVLCRLDGIESNPRDKAIQELLWRRAEEVLPSKGIGDFNSALMELGATVCTPRNPQCLLCPVQSACEAFASGRQHEIPRRRQRETSPLVRRWTYCIEHKGRWLIERRPAKGRWAGLWQFVTRDTPTADGFIHFPICGAGSGEMAKLKVAGICEIGRLRHTLTHRRYDFTVYRCRLAGAMPAKGADAAWVPMHDIDRYPLSKPQLQFAQWAADRDP